LLSKNPRNLEAIELAASVYEKSNKVTNAISMYKKYLALAGNHKEYSFRLAELYEKQGMKRRPRPSMRSISENSRMIPGVSSV
jgi:predicted Zn-dependent protease